VRASKTTADFLERLVEFAPTVDDVVGDEDQASGRVRRLEVSEQGRVVARLPGEERLRILDPDQAARGHHREGARRVDDAIEGQLVAGVEAVEVEVLRKPGRDLRPQPIERAAGQKRRLAVQQVDGRLTVLQDAGRCRVALFRGCH
jgi:hypothetical protein